MSRRVRVAAPLAALLALSACGGGGNALTSNPIPGFTANPGQTAAAKLTIAGIGDSLTAGVQSGGLLGAQIPGGAAAGALGTIGNVQETQEHGFFALLWEQANGVAQSVLENPATSPLPLIAPPGVGGMLAKTTSGFPAGLTVSCQGGRLAAFAPSGALGDRLNPATTPFDVAVPGQTVHEAVAMFQPLGGCVPAANQAQLAQSPDGRAQLALAQLVSGESENFYPVLANFGTQVTQLQAAASLHAQLATVWLGSNDLLHFLGSNGQAPVTDPTSLGNDLATVVKTLQAGGTKVAIANLVDVLGASLFFPQPIYAAALQAAVKAGIEAQVEAKFGVTKAQADVLAAAQIAAAQSAAAQAAAAQTAQARLGSNGYFLLATFLGTAGAILQGQAPPAVDAPGTGQNGAGQYVSDSVAVTARSLNAAYNTAIGGVASATSAALVDVAAVFAAAEAATQAGQPFLVPGSSGAYVSLAYGGGFTSLDGIHPSNTGYAAIANLFIRAFDTKYALTIPPVNVDAVYAADPYAPQNFGNPFVPLSVYARRAR